METIKTYLENMFSGLPDTPEVRKARYELEQMMEDKYSELKSSGKSENEAIETGLKKFGAMLGDNVEVGCGSVLNPGTVIGPNSNIYPLSSVRGIVPAGSIYKHAGEVVIKQVEE